MRTRARANVTQCWRLEPSGWRIICARHGVGPEGGGIGLCVERSVGDADSGPRHPQGGGAFCRSTRDTRPERTRLHAGGPPARLVLVTHSALTNRRPGMTLSSCSSDADWPAIAARPSTARDKRACNTATPRLRDLHLGLHLRDAERASLSRTVAFSILQHLRSSARHSPSDARVLQFAFAELRCQQSPRSRQF